MVPVSVRPSARAVCSCMLCAPSCGATVTALPSCIGGLPRRQVGFRAGMPTARFPEPTERQWERLVGVLLHPLHERLRVLRLPPVATVGPSHGLEQGLQ